MIQNEVSLGGSPKIDVPLVKSKVILFLMINTYPYPLHKGPLPFFLVK